MAPMAASATSKCPPLPIPEHPWEHTFLPTSPTNSSDGGFHSSHFRFREHPVGSYIHLYIRYFVPVFRTRVLIPRLPTFQKPFFGTGRHGPSHAQKISPLPTTGKQLQASPLKKLNRENPNRLEILFLSFSDYYSANFTERISRIRQGLRSGESFFHR